VGSGVTTSKAKKFTSPNGCAGLKPLMLMVASEIGSKDRVSNLCTPAPPRPTSTIVRRSLAPGVPPPPTVGADGPR
jgi:hypothetical protein